MKGGGAEFFSPIQTGPGVHSASDIMGTGAFPGVKRLGRGVNHPPHLASRLKEVYGCISTPPLDLHRSKVNFSLYLIILRNFGIFDSILRVVFLYTHKENGTVSWLRRLVAGLTPHRSRLIPWSAYLRFVVDKMTLGHISI